MKSGKKQRHLVWILAVGALACAGALGYRTFYGKPIYGDWVGYSYNKIDGKLVKDELMGEYLMRINRDGTYAENGNSTSGTWTLKNNILTMVPTKFYDMTPDEHRKRFVTSKGKVSVTIERLLKSKMQPMVANYSSMNDRIIYREPSAYYEFERATD